TRLGGVVLHAAQLPLVEGREHTQLVFSVSDTGPGIAADELKHLGEAFVQARAGRQGKEGTGLGLALSRNFVQLLGGDLKLMSEPGQGTTIEFTLPVAIVDASSVSTISRSNHRVIGLAPGQLIYRILIVEDRPESRQLLNRLLTQLGFEVREACNGE